MYKQVLHKNILYVHVSLLSPCPCPWLNTVCAPSPPLPFFPLRSIVCKQISELWFNHSGCSNIWPLPFPSRPCGNRRCLWTSSLTLLPNCQALCQSVKTALHVSKWMWMHLKKHVARSQTLNLTSSVYESQLLLIMLILCQAFIVFLMQYLQVLSQKISIVKQTPNLWLKATVKKFIYSNTL